MSETDTMTEIENAILALDTSLGCLKSKEKGLVRHLAYGESVGPNFSKAPCPDISQPSEVLEEITVRGRLIRVLCGWAGVGNLGQSAIIALADAYVPDPIELNHMRIQRALLFHNCVFGDKVSMMHAECPALYMNGCHLHKGLNASGIKIKGSVFLREGFVAKGRVTLSVANIGGELDCTNGKFAKFQSDASDPDAFDKPVHPFKDYAIAAGGIRVGNRVRIGGQSFEANGIVELTGANIGSDLICDGGTFINHGGVAIAAERIKTDSDIRMGSGFRAEGEVLLLGARIGGILDCAGGEFINPHGKNAINAGSIETKGHVYLNKHPCYGPLIAKGKVRLASANVGGNLNCKGGQFNCGEQNFAISASGLKTRGAVIFSDGFSIIGNVQLHVAQIGGNFVCAEHAKPTKKLEGVSDLINIAGDETAPCPRSIINLEFAKAFAVQNDQRTCEKYNFCLDGFSYGGFFGDKSPKNAEQCLKWLNSRPKGTVFSPLPYEQAAKVLRTMGKDIDAWKIEREKNRLQREFGGVSPFKKLGESFLDVLKDAIYRPFQIVKWGFCVVAFGVAVYACADYYGNIIPTHPVVALSEGYKGQIAPNGDLLPTQAVTPEYPTFNPLMFSLDVFTPAAVFHQEDSWGPRAGGEVWWIMPLVVFAFLWVTFVLCGFWFAVIALLSWLGCIEKRKEGILCGCGLGAGVIVVLTGLAFLYVGFLNILWLLTLWYWAEVAMGWILTSMLLLSVTGLLRPRQSPGEKD